MKSGPLIFHFHDIFNFKSFDCQYLSIKERPFGLRYDYNFEKKN